MVHSVPSLGVADQEVFWENDLRVDSGVFLRPVRVCVCGYRVWDGGEPWFVELSVSVKVGKGSVTGGKDVAVLAEGGAVVR